MAARRLPLAATRTRLPAALAVAAIAALRLGGLGTVPPGLHADEASVGYNAWAIGHFGVDEHGARMPLYFAAFGEYKNPLYIYLLAPLTRILPLTAATIRLPAALCSLAATLLVAAAVRNLGVGRAATWLTLGTAAVTPWLVVQGRVGFEVATVTPLLAAALFGLCRAWGPVGDPRAAWFAGCALGLSVFAYTTARLYVPALVLGIAATEIALARRRSTLRRLLPVVLPALAGSAVYAAWALSHWRAATGRFSGLSIGADQPGPLTLGVRLLRNLASYDSVAFLFTQGDHLLRHATGAGGMLLVTTGPPLLAGTWLCLRTLDQPLSRTLLLALAVAPLPAALTDDNTPHALRAAPMLPVLLVLAGRGFGVLVPLLRGRRLAAGLVGLALLADAGTFLEDAVLRWPDRTVAGSVLDTADGPYLATNQFEAGVQDAIRAGHQAAGGHRLHLSSLIDQVGEEALAALTPAPVGTGDLRRDQVAELASVDAVVDGDADAVVLDARRGDVAVIAGNEAGPPGWTHLADEVWRFSPQHPLAGSGGSTVVLATVWRLDG